MPLGAAMQRRVPFQEGVARIQRAGAFFDTATVEAVVVGEGVALFAGVMVLVYNKSVRGRLKIAML